MHSQDIFDSRSLWIIYRRTYCQSTYSVYFRSILKFFLAKKYSFSTKILSIFLHSFCKNIYTYTTIGFLYTQKLLKILATVNTRIKYTLAFPVNQFNENHNDWGYALSMLSLNWGIPKKGSSSAPRLSTDLNFSK